MGLERDEKIKNREITCFRKIGRKSIEASEETNSKLISRNCKNCRKIEMVR